MIKLGALWKNKDGQGLSGSINDTARILVLKNGFKKAENHPDYILYVVENERKNVGAKAAAPKEEEAPF